MRKNILPCLWGTLSFFSRFPIPSGVFQEGARFQICPELFPIVGCAIGACLGLLWFSLESVPPLVSAVVLVVFWSAMTGGIHWDGWADTWETALAGQSPEEKERIRKDPHLGTFGVLSLVLGVLLKTVLLGTFFYRPVDLVLVTVWARGGLPLLIFLVYRFLPSIPLSGGLGGAFFKGLSGTRIVVTTVLTLLLMSLMTGIKDIPVLAASLLLVLVPASWVLKKQDALSGDFMGFCVELLEMVSLTVLGEMSHMNIGSTLRG